MSQLKEALEKKFGVNNVSDFSYEEEDYINLLKIDIDARTSYTLIMTDGMSNYKMPVPENSKYNAFNELYFCLPSYWDLKDLENPNMNWPFKTLQKLAKNVIENETWYGPGHTISNGNPPEPISQNMKQEYFLIATPIELEDRLLPLILSGKQINFLSVIPLFKDEFEHRSGRNYTKWIRKFRLRNGNEVLDDFRSSKVKRSWNPFS